MPSMYQEICRQPAREAQRGVDTPPSWIRGSANLRFGGPGHRRVTFLAFFFSPVSPESMFGPRLGSCVFLPTTFLAMNYPYKQTRYCSRVSTYYMYSPICLTAPAKTWAS